MKKMRKLIPAFSMLLVAAIMLSTASYAWFTMGTKATATGMEVTAQTASSMLIVNAEGKTESNLAAAFQGATNSATLDKYTDKALQPATLYDETKTPMAEGTAKENDLVTLADATKVDNAKGTLLTDAKFKLAESGTNYYDYVVYIAAAGTKMATQGHTLQATVSISGDIATYINNALSIQFIVTDKTSATEASYTTKINLHQVDAEDGNSLVVDLKTQEIPAALNINDDGSFAGVNDYVKVIMRVYYDGSLEDGNTGKTYIRNEKITGDSAAFAVQFDYKAPAA